MLEPCHDAVRGTCLPGGQLHLSFNHTQHSAELLPQCVHLRTGRAAEARALPLILTLYSQPYTRSIPLP
jgi:hypothetical protein